MVALIFFVAILADEMGLGKTVQVHCYLVFDVFHLQFWVSILFLRDLSITF